MIPRRYEVEFPFSRVPGGAHWSGGCAWKPGVLTLKKDDGPAHYEAHGMGRMIITEVARVRPPGYHERVIYTRTWIDPDGAEMGYPRRLRMTAAGAFKSLVAGYRQRFEITDWQGTADEPTRK